MGASMASVYKHIMTSLIRNGTPTTEEVSRKAVTDPNKPLAIRRMDNLSPSSAMRMWYPKTSTRILGKVLGRKSLSQFSPGDCGDVKDAKACAPRPGTAIKL